MVRTPVPPALLWVRPILLLAALALTSCGILPPRPPLAVPAQTPTPTVPVMPFLDVHGSQTTYLSHTFSAPGIGWHALWRYDCRRAIRTRLQAPWFLTVEARHAHPSQRPASQSIAAAGADVHPASGASPAHASGSTAMSIRGSMHIRVRASKGCTWSVAALP